MSRPTTNVKMFASCSGGDLATFVCPLDKKALGVAKVIPAGYYALKNRDRFDAAKGPR